MRYSVSPDSFSNRYSQIEKNKKKIKSNLKIEVMNLRAMHYFPFPSELKASICLGQGGSTLLLNLQEELDRGTQHCSCGKEKGDRGETILGIALFSTDFYCLFL